MSYLRSALGFGLSLFVLLILSCTKDEEPSGFKDRGGPEREPRPFLTGVSSLPFESGEEAYRAAFKLAGEAGEVILIQRAPPWSDFVPGATISERTERLTRFEKELAHEQGLRMFLAIDPTEPADRGRLANLSDDLRGKDFSDGRVRAAFIAYAKYLALNYKPAYMALGVEVDMFYARRGDGAFRNLVSLYFEAYDAVKSVSSETLVAPIFQLENLQGLLKTPEPVTATWALIRSFEPKLDMLAVTSFPGLAFQSVENLPQDYYQRLQGRSNKPLVFASVGWSSATQPDALSAGEDEQFAFLRRVLAAADDLSARLLVWYLGRDPRVSAGLNFDALLTMGLHDREGRPKSAWRLWEVNVQRPIPK